MGLSLKESIASSFAIMAMVGIIGGVPAPESQEQHALQNPLSEISYCDAECNAHLGGVGKMVKSFMDADRKRHGKHDHEIGDVYVVDDPIMDGVEHFVYFPHDEVEIVETIKPV